MAKKPEDFTDLVLDYDDIGAVEDEGPTETDDGIKDETLQEVVAQLRYDVENAIDLFESDFEAERERAQKYYNGETDLPSAGDNRSKYVHTKVRDTVRALKPDIIRVLVGGYCPVEFVPPTMQLAQIAEQQTRYVSQLFDRMGGYSLVYDAIHTACLHKMGIAKVWYEDVKKPEYTAYTGIDEQQLQYLQSIPDITVIIDSEDQEERVGPNGPEEVTTYDVDVVSFIQKGRVRMQSIAPEDFLIDEWATSESDFKVIGHRRNITVSDAVAMGFDKAMVEELDAQDPETSDAVGLSEKRRGYQLRSGEDKERRDSTEKMFLLTEAYTRADLDGLGVSQLYRFWLGGTSHRYLDHERVDDHPFALFMIDPEPFTVFGKSLYDLTHKDQDVETSLMRAIVDNAHMSNNPRLGVHETLVNMEDVLNNDIGAPIRFRGVGQIQPITVPFTGGNLLPLMQYLDQATDNKTGITRASVGLDPSAMQSTDKQAVQNTIAKQAGQVELAVRNLAETGMKRLFKLLLKVTLENPNPMEVMRLSGAYVTAPLDAFNPELDMEVCVGVGNATYEQRIAALQQVKAEQDKMFQMLGPGNPVVSLTQMFNTIQDGLECVGIKNIQRYFTPITPQLEAQIAEQMKAAQQAKEQQPPQPDPTQAIIEAEKIKAQTKMQTDSQKNQLDMAKAQQKNALDMQTAAQKNQLDLAKLRAEMGYKIAAAMKEDDLSRDQMLQDLFLQLAQMQVQSGTQIETANIAAEVQKRQAANNARKVN